VPGVGLKEKGGFQITKPCRGNCNFAVQTFSISWEEYNCPHCEFVKTPKLGYLSGFSLWGLPLALIGKDIIVFIFIREYSSFKGFWPLGNSRSILMQGFLKDDILACVET